MSLMGCAGLAGLDDYGPAAEQTPVAELCDNGEDDDLDGQTDCLDDDCGDRVCIEAVPPDFEGPIVLVTGDEPPSCAAGSQVFSGGTALTSDTTSCDACCIVRGGCEATLSFALQRICDESPEVTMASPECTTLASLTGDYTHVEVVVTDGQTSCTRANDLPPPFDDWIGGCQIEGGAGCGPSELCVLDDMAAGICVYRSGDVGCPATGYTNKTLVQTVVKDDRNCASCSCTPSGTPLCAGSIELYEKADCDGAFTPQGAPSSCTSFTPPVQSVHYRPGSIGECAASGSLDGSVDLEDITVCCLP